MTLFPMFVKLEGRSCLVVGAGSIGEPKIGSLLASGGTVRVIAPNASATVAEWARAGTIVWEAREFQTTDLDGVFLVIGATSSRDVNVSLPSRPTATVRPSPKESGAIWKFSLERNTASGSRIWERSGSNCLPAG